MRLKPEELEACTFDVDEEFTEAVSSSHILRAKMHNGEEVIFLAKDYALGLMHDVKNENGIEFLVVFINSMLEDKENLSGDRIWEFLTQMKAQMDGDVEAYMQLLDSVRKKYRRGKRDKINTARVGRGKYFFHYPSKSLSKSSRCKHRRRSKVVGKDLFKRGTYWK